MSGFNHLIVRRIKAFDIVVERLEHGEWVERKRIRAGEWKGEVIHIPYRGPAATIRTRYERPRDAPPPDTTLS